ncbi:pyridine nucleotide-disulfide oxidoreductase/dicluster-binding protein [Pseudodesulfovibrio sediminis]|uniref:4Fe-4S ferredoxin-type domain-containing protein n=1 Tax=Pseudodesulfovibrio sediminis TaxID=2810563 RepID=A0ABN6ENY9_9BACT|nr:pyridine nucleotide-disulfide oxidoreductase/dicluster-binding protein [Pseudodesulfovibrio sediminis]BCS88047.1 hypothetical protein PSDVSF_12890 [Pseudodesulfovibrio sediminis]
MEQADLRHWENKCVQEEAPQCTASCPLHVDVRTFCSLMAQRRWDKAWTILAKTLPLPGVLARLCNGPCKSHCVRKDAGGAIAMDSLERFCADNAKPVAPPRPLPNRKKTVAVVGTTLTGLCAAWEMARRGFDVTLISSDIANSLAYLPIDSLPEGTVERELANLEKLGVVVNDKETLSAKLITSLIETYDAVFLDSDAAPALSTEYGTPDDLTFGTQITGLFVSPKGETSAILQAACGRRAANSIERFTQGVSLVSNRELEGPYPTRLFTSLEGVEVQAPLIDSGNCTELEARDEAKRCIQCECMECVKQCEYLKHFKSYPKIYARQIYNNESIVMGTRQANSMINSCMLCGLCETICPEDFSMADVCLAARRTLVEQGNMPPSAHDFALRDMAFANGEKCTLVRHAPGTDTSEYLFFPGCQLTASDPDGVERAYADLRARMDNVGLFLHCCGAPAKWSGRETLTNYVMTELRTGWESLGKPKIIAACPSCIKELREGLPDAEILSHWSILSALGVPETALKATATFAINDPCAARHDKVVQDDVRALLDKLQVTVVEPPLTGETTQCCGYGGLLSEANPQLADIVTRQRAGTMDEDIVTYCVMCRDMMAKTGKGAIHIYDLLYPETGNRADRAAPGYSARRENRVHLKEALLSGVWQDADDIPALPHESVVVQYTDKAAAIMEERRILHTDVQKVLYAASQSGKRFVHSESGHLLASFRPVVVTYWVEYEPVDDGYLVHKSWSHRMHIKGAKA